MKVALISYHKNVFTLYNPKWIQKHVETVINQSYKDFDIYELDYGGNGNRIFPYSKYRSNIFPTFVDAMNYLLDKLFNEEEYDVVGNLNCDDYYDLERLEKQLAWVRSGYNIVTSNYTLIKNGDEALITEYDKKDIRKELGRGNNIVAHPAILLTKGFWKTGLRYDPSEIPAEDMKLWIRALNFGFNIKIAPEPLLYYRIHENSVCNNVNSR